jgi:hypothetical protein
LIELLDKLLPNDGTPVQRPPGKVRNNIEVLVEGVAIGAVVTIVASYSTEPMLSGVSEILVFDTWRSELVVGRVSLRRLDTKGWEGTQGLYGHELPSLSAVLE